MTLSASILDNKLRFLPVKSNFVRCTDKPGREISDGGRKAVKLTHSLIIAHIMPCLSHQSDHGGLHKALELLMSIDVACVRAYSVP